MSNDRIVIREPRLDLGTNREVPTTFTGEQAYDWLGIHHPKTNAAAVRAGNPAAVDRPAAFVDDELEAVRTRGDRNGIPLVMKDLIFETTGGNSSVMVPNPVKGYVQFLNDGTNAISIWSKPIGSPENELVGQVLHGARGSSPYKTGDLVEYGAPLVRQSDVGSPGAVHAHIELEPAQFKKYLGDILSERINTQRRPDDNGQAQPSQPSRPADALADGVLRRNEEGAAVKKLQEDLTKAGFSTQGADGKFGQNTEDALKRYQQTRGLEVDGIAGQSTLKALRENQPAQQPTTQQPTATNTPSTPANPAPQSAGDKTFLEKQTPEVRAYLDLVALKEVNKSLNADGSPTGYLERNGVKGSMGFMPQSAIADNGTLPRDELRYNVGRYQMKQVDVDDMRARYDKKIDDFSPESQDRIAVAKMKYRGVMEPLENGDIRSAIKKGGQEWASLPGSPYGQVQSGYTADQAVEYYNKRLAFHQAQDRGQNAPTQGESKPSPSQGTGALADGVLKQGEKGEDVRKLQEALNKNGAKLEADGNFGPATKAAVESYQRSHSLDTDGVAGAKTLASLGMAQTQSTPVAATIPPPPQVVQPNPQQPITSEKPQATAPNAPTPPANAQPAQPAAPNAPTPPAANDHGHSHAPTQQTPPANAQPAQPAAPNAPTPPASAQPAQTEKLPISNPTHPDNKLYQQALSNLEQLGPSGGFKSRGDLENAAASVAADAKLTKPPLTEITHISKTTAPNGQTFLVATQGDPTNPGANRSYIDYNQATTQTVAQSTSMAEAQKPVVQQAQAPAAQQTDPQPEPVRLAASGR